MSNMKNYVWLSKIKYLLRLNKLEWREDQQTVLEMEDIGVCP